MFNGQNVIINNDSPKKKEWINLCDEDFLVESKNNNCIIFSSGNKENPLLLLHANINNVNKNPVFSFLLSQGITPYKKNVNLNKINLPIIDNKKSVKKYKYSFEIDNIICNHKKLVYNLHNFFEDIKNNQKKTKTFHKTCNKDNKKNICIIFKETENKAKSRNYGKNKNSKKNSESKNLKINQIRTLNLSQNIPESILASIDYHKKK